MDAALPGHANSEDDLVRVCEEQGGFSSGIYLGYRDATSATVRFRTDTVNEMPWPGEGILFWFVRETPNKPTGERCLP